MFKVGCASGLGLCATQQKTGVSSSYFSYGQEWVVRWLNEARKTKKICSPFSLWAETVTIPSRAGGNTIANISPLEGGPLDASLDAPHGQLQRTSKHATALYVHAASLKRTIMQDHITPKTTNVSFFATQWQSEMLTLDHFRTLHCFESFPSRNVQDVGQIFPPWLRWVLKAEASDGPPLCWQPCGLWECVLDALVSHSENASQLQHTTSLSCGRRFSPKWHTSDAI